MSGTCFWPSLRPWSTTQCHSFGCCGRSSCPTPHSQLGCSKHPQTKPIFYPTLHLFFLSSALKTPGPFTTSSLVLYEYKSWFLSGVVKSHPCMWLCCLPWVCSDRVVVVALSILTWKWALAFGMDVDKAGPWTVHQASRRIHPR